MVTDTQAGAGPSPSGLSLKNDKPAHDSVAEAHTASKGAFAAILAETVSETVEVGAPMMPTSEEERPGSAPSDPGRTTSEEEGSVSSRDPDIQRVDARGDDAGRLRQVTTATASDDTGIWEDQSVTPRETPTSTATGTGIAGHAVMSAPPAISQTSSQAAPRVGMMANRVGMDGAAGAGQAVARGNGEAVRLAASPGDDTVSAKPGVDENHGETKAVPVAERPLRAGVRGLSAPVNGVVSWPDRAAAAHGPSEPLSAIVPSLVGAAGIAPSDAPLVPGGLSRSGSAFALPTLSMPEAAQRSGGSTGPSRPNGSAVTQTFALPGVTYPGLTPVMGAPGHSIFGSLPRSEHAQTSDGGSTVPDARFSGQHASATSLAAPAVPYRHDLPHQIMVQIAAAVEQGKAGTQKNIDLSLNPEELGRVRFRLSPSEGGLNVVIVAERSETLDLLRRNIDMLAREFLEIGYEGASFDFAGGQQEQADGHESIPPVPVSAVQGTAPAIQTGEIYALAFGDRLDIRL